MAAEEALKCVTVYSKQLNLIILPLSFSISGISLRLGGNLWLSSSIRRSKHSFVYMLYYLSNMVLFMFVTFPLSLCIPTSADSSFVISFMLP